MQKEDARKFLVPIVATIASLLVLILAACVIFWFMRRKKGQVIGLEVQTSKIDGSLEMKNRQFTFLEVQSMTDNFQRVVGKGRFGTVYHGNVQGTQVAVLHEMRIKLAPTNEKDKQQLQRFCYACKGIPQVSVKN